MRNCTWVKSWILHHQQKAVGAFLNPHKELELNETSDFKSYAWLFLV